MNQPDIFGVASFVSKCLALLGMVCDRQMNLNFAADAALRPFMAATFQA
jgi:hypothetical protein